MLNKHSLKQWIKYISIVLFIVFLIISVALWKLAGQFVNSRNDVSPYVTQFMRELFHSVKIEKLNCADKTRCLLLTPIKGAAPHVRATLLRKQLAQFGVTPKPYGEVQGIAVMLHGKSSRKENSIYTGLRLTAAGLAVIIPDLSGHGENELPYSGFGTLDGEADIAIQSLDYAKTYLKNQYHITQPLPAALWGYSMGGSFANYTVAKYPRYFNALVIQSSLDRMQTILTDRVHFLPKLLQRPTIAYFRLLVRIRSGVDIDKIAPINVARNIDLPVIQFHGKQDKVIPYSSGKTLHNAYPNTDKQFITIPDGGHNDSLNKRTLVYAPVIAFILQHIEKKQ